MTEKKLRSRRAKALRKQIKGLNFISSISLIKKIHYWDEFVSILEADGYSVEINIDYWCPDDWAPIGKMVIYKNEVPVGNLEYDCCGIKVDPC